MQEILDTLRRVKQTIRTYRNALVGNQLLTRYALVDLVLKSTGWDVHDPSQVYHNWDLGHTGEKADYALLDHAGRPVAAIKVTSLSGFALPDIARWVEPVMESSIRFALMTDGNFWLLADASPAWHGEDRELMRLILEGDPENFLLVNLASLAPANLRELGMAYFPNQPARVMETQAPPPLSQGPAVDPTLRRGGTGPLIGTSPYRQQTNPLDDIEPIPAQAAAMGQPTQAQINSAEWLPVSEIVHAITAPMMLRFPDSSVEATQGSYQRVLSHLAEYIIRHNKFFQAPVEDYEGKKKFLINLIPTHKDGSPFAAKVMLFNGWYMETGYSPADCKKNAIWLIQKAGENPNNYFFS